MDIENNTWDKLKTTSSIEIIDYMLLQYKIYKSESLYRTMKEETKLDNMTNEYINLKIKECEKNKINSDFGIAWIRIFNLELNKRRMNKIMKIKKNI